MPNSDLVAAARDHPYFLLYKNPRDARVLQAMSKIDSYNFLPPLSQHLAYQDEAVPIGYGATCSQPSLVALMSDLLELKPGLKVFEGGRGCGYQTTMTYELIKGKGDDGREGELITSEIVTELADWGQDNVIKYYGLEANIDYLLPDGSKGIPGEIFDRIYFTAAVNKNTFNPQILLDQLKTSGIFMVPEKTTSSLYVFIKGKEKTEIKRIPQIQFVCLQGVNK